MPEPVTTLRRLARLMGVATHYRDGLGRDVEVSPETLVHVCASMGAPMERVDDAEAALRELHAARTDELVAPVLVAWDGVLDLVLVADSTEGPIRCEMILEDGTRLLAESDSATIGFAQPLPPGYHRLRVEADNRSASSTVIAAPARSWHRSDERAGWGVSAHLAALRSTRSRSVGDLTDLMTLCDWIGTRGGDLVTLLPLLPTFNEPPVEPSPYSPVSRLFWSELILDLGTAHRTRPVASLLRTEDAGAEVRAALRDTPPPDPASVDDELAQYAMFRAAQKLLGRDWRRWPQRQRDGGLRAGDLDADEERFHLVAQTEVRRQLADLRRHLDERGVLLGLDLTVGVHPHGYDAWSRPGLFAPGVSVGAPPDAGFPSGQGWGFPPVLPQRSRLEGHSYIAASIAGQAALAGVLRIDHVMAMRRLYWIPEGMDLAEGTYVDYPSEELFAVLCLESHRNECELIGENLGTVLPEIDEALPRHAIAGMYLAEFAAASGPPIEAPRAHEAAMIGTHDTPTFAGWIGGVDIEERVRLGLLDAGDAPREHADRRRAVDALARHLGGQADDPDELLSLVLEWLGGSESPLVSSDWIAQVDQWLMEGGADGVGFVSGEAAAMDALSGDALITAARYAASGGPALSERLVTILQAGAQAVHADRLSLWGLDDATTELRQQAAWGPSVASVPDARRRLAEAVADLEALAGRAVVLEDNTLCEHWRVPQPCGAAASTCRSTL